MILETEFLFRNRPLLPGGRNRGRGADSSASTRLGPHFSNACVQRRFSAGSWLHLLYSLYGNRRFHMWLSSVAANA